MEATERRRAAADRVRVAEDTVAQLKKGLAGLGVTLPSLRVDPVSCAGNEPTPLVDLGRCNIETALRLCEVLAESAEKRSGHGG
ncbi:MULTISPECIES: hypothetical protein [unclassified Streptomyces]|uniref:hypothetical protein n=1 Tax=unclassified Streptomyces TaxID=2593676 RepID=UPI00369D8A83